MNNVNLQTKRTKDNKRKFGQILVDYGFLSPAQLSSGLRTHRHSGRFLGETLVDDGIICREAWLNALSLHLGLPSIDLRSYSPDEKTIRTIPEEICRSNTIIAVDHDGSKVATAMRFPQNTNLVREIKIETGKAILPVIGWADDIERRLDEVYNSNPYNHDQTGGESSILRMADEDNHLFQELDSLFLHSRLYFTALKKTLSFIPLDVIHEIVEILILAYHEERKVFIMGNGGSAATASHFCCDLGKGTAAYGKKRFRVISLTDNIPLLTAWSNDTRYHYAFVEQLKNLMQPKDVVIGISGSGNSPNVLNAIDYANSKGATTIGLTGFSGGKIRDMVTVCLIVPSYSMEQIEDVHLVLGHLICTHLRKVVKDETKDYGWVMSGNTAYDL